MTAKIVEVLALILDGINNDLSLEEVNYSLSEGNKYDKQTLSAAFSLVYDKMLSNKVRGKAKKEKVRRLRAFTEEEKDLLGIDNLNYIIHLMNVGLLESYDIEMLLEQLLMFPEDKISKEDINWIILVSLVEFNSKILPGSRILLYSSDTIN